MEDWLHCILHGTFITKRSLQLCLCSGKSLSKIVLFFRTKFCACKEEQYLYMYETLLRKWLKIWLNNYHSSSSTSSSFIAPESAYIHFISKLLWLATKRVQMRTRTISRSVVTSKVTAFALASLFGVVYGYSNVNLLQKQGISFEVTDNLPLMMNRLCWLHLVSFVYIL